MRAQAERPGEYEVKAAFLYNFAKFVEWPAEAFSNPSAPIRLCVLGEDPFGRVLDQTVQDKSVNGRTLLILRSQQVRELRACHILFIGASEQNRLPEIFTALRGSSALSVGDTEQFVQSGGAIQFTLQDSRVRFTINLAAAERARLKISSKLLSLARVVRDDAPKGG
ncbi:MAG: YfiR family protein [Acidobacteriia bacterium]|nr:YfiR family protein [Terriglobia bacterium]